MFYFRSHPQHGVLRHNRVLYTQILHLIGSSRTNVVAEVSSRTTLYLPSETPQSLKPAVPCTRVQSCPALIPRNNLTNRQSAVIEGCVRSTVSAAIVREAKCPGLRTSPSQELPHPKIPDLASVARIPIPNQIFVPNSRDVHYRISPVGDAHNRHDHPRPHAAVVDGNGGGAAPLGGPPHAHTHHTPKQKGTDGRREPTLIALLILP